MIFAEAPHIVEYVRLKIHRFAALLVTMMKTPEVAQKGH
jgi:hypothetical protein